MKPLLVLISVFCISAFIIKFITKTYNLPLAARIAMCVMLCFTAIGHVVLTKGLAMMIPDVVPFKIELVYLTGILEVLLGIGLLIPSVRRYAAWALIVFFILILPTNIYAAIIHLDYETGTFDGSGVAYLWFRVPLQLLFILWVYISSIKESYLNEE